MLEIDETEKEEEVSNATEAEENNTEGSSDENDKLGENLIDETLGSSKQDEIQIAAPKGNDVTTCLKKFDMSSIQKPNAKAHQARKGGNPDFAVVNTRDNGRRVKLSKHMLEKLGLISIEESFIDIAFVQNGVVLSSDLAGAGERFRLSKGGHIYSKALVEEITSRFKLDFNEVTTRSFSASEYQVSENGCMVAIINM